MMVRSAMRVVLVIVAVGMVLVVRMIMRLRRRGGAEGGGTVQRPQKRQERTPLHPQ